MRAVIFLPVKKILYAGTQMNIMNYKDSMASLLLKKSEVLHSLCFKITSQRLHFTFKPSMVLCGKQRY
jgi:hypothetical protein